MLAPHPPTSIALRTPALIALGLAAAALAAAFGTGTIAAPSFGDVMADAADTLGAWTYATVPGLAFLETAAFVGLVVPGETAVIVGGVVAERGAVSLPVLIVLVWIAAVGGDVVSFLLGRRLGRRFLEQHGPRLHIGPAELTRADRFFARHGGKAILLGRFVGVLRALMPFVAGAANARLRRILPYSVAGSLVWATGLTLVGFGFSDSFESAGETTTRIVLVAALLGFAVFIAVERLRRRRKLV